jgi:putative ABC transport system permease protein
VKLRTLAWFYGRRLRVHWMQELLAGLGIAIGVALVFAVQVANSSITGSAQQMLKAISGDATLQVAARDSHGFDAALTERVRNVPGVAAAAPILEQRATIVYRGHRVPIDLVGVDQRLTGLGGTAARSFLLGALLGQPGILVPAGVGARLHLPTDPDAASPPRVSIDVRGRRSTVPVRAVVGEEAIGPLANALMGVGSLPYVQRLTALPDRATRILVQPRPGSEDMVRRELTTLAGDRLTVAPVDSEVTALEQAVAPNDQATELFALISALVGLLFAFNAMLLTMPERRRAIAELRIHGYETAKIVSLVAFQALVLGAVASAAGLVLGDLLSRAAAQNPPSYLSFAFPLGTHRVVPFSSLLIAWIGGVTVTCLVAAVSLLDLRNAHPTGAISSADSEPGNSLSPRLATRLAAVGMAIAAATTAMVVLAPSTTVVGLLGITIAAVLIVPAAFRLVLQLLDAPARRLRMNSLVLALRALRATSIRSLALAATGAVAVFGSIAIEGAHRDLVQGLDDNFADYLASGDLWATTGGDENSLTTQSFPAEAALRHVRAVPAVAAARPYFGGMLDVGGRRAWIIGRPPEDRDIVPPSQLDEGNLATAGDLIRRGGWAAVSRVLADGLRTGVNGRITLPTPSGMRTFRIAATLTNLGWGPGAVIINANDYRRAWLTNDPSAIEVNLRPGVSPASARREVQAALGPGQALRVQTYDERNHQFQTLARQGLARLSQISALLLIAAALAMAAAMGAAIWQRRIPLARMRIDGFEPIKLWTTLMIEAGVVLGIGATIGATAGTYGHLLGGRWLSMTTGFPAPFEIGVLSAITTCLFVGAGALAVTTIPGAFAANTSPRVGLQEQ